MNILEQIASDYLEAYKAHDELKTSTLRLLKSALQNAQIEKKGQLSDDDVVSVLKREAKQRRDSISEFKKAGRNEMALKEENELSIIESYLPEQFTEEKIREIASDAIKQIGATDMSQMGQVIGKIMSEHGSKVDGGTVSKIVRELLQ